jgi:thiol:disulfide interchange protein/DsbC/DsbD-like thiol-disulfide interchange protein
MFGSLPLLAGAISIAVAGSAGSTLLSPGTTLGPTIGFSDVPASATGQPKGTPNRPHPAVARLVFDRTTVAAGSTARVAIHLDQQENWHTYWHSPGDIGRPTEIAWTAPDGVEVDPFTYAVPARFELQGIVSYGYDKQALHVSDMTVPADQPLGPMTIGAKVGWLICEVQCIPGETTLSRTIDVVAVGTPTIPSLAATLFDHTVALHPRPMDELGDLQVAMRVPKQLVGPEQKQTVTMSVTRPSGPLTATTEAKTWPVFTPIVGDQWMVNDVRVKRSENEIQIEMDVETFAPEVVPTGDRIGGLLQFQVGEEWVRTELLQPVTWVLGGAAQAATPAPTAPLKPVTPAPPVDSGSTSLLFMLLLAFAGGMLLNVMPCVLPVVLMKLRSLIEQQSVDDAERHTAGLAYTAGILVSFLGLGGMVIVLRTVSGIQVGWGYQFQSPVFVAVLATIVFVFGLSLFDIVDVPVFGSTTMDRAGAKKGWVGHFMTGGFATLIATPCSAPFLGTGMGFAFTLPAWGVLLFFGVAGFGLAMPFLLVAFVPALFKFLPGPGAWMDTFKTVLGFTLMATTVWLVDVLAAQTGSDGAIGFLAFLTVVSLSCWIIGKWAGPTVSTKPKLIALAIALGLSVLGGAQFLKLDFSEVSSSGDGPIAVADLDFSTHIPWQPFSGARVDELAGHMVFVDFTAEWCLTCKVNEKTVLESEAVRQAMAENKVVPLVADWTRQDPEITEWLRRYGRAGVPFYLVIPADRARPSIPLPEVVTPGIVIDGLIEGRG